MTAAQLRRIGKSLLKYFQPVRTTEPHSVPRLPLEAPGMGALFEQEKPPKVDPQAARAQGQPLPQGAAAPQRPELQILTGGRPADEPDRRSGERRSRGEQRPGVAAGGLAQSLAEPPMPLGDPKHWLDLVVHLLAACRRASQSMNRRIGVDTYLKVSRSRGKQKMRSVVGSIVDTLPEEEKIKRSA